MSKKSGDRNRRLRAYSDDVTRLMREEQGKQTLNPKQISVRLGITDSMDRILLEEAIEKLCLQKILEQVEPGQYRLRTKSVDPVAVAGVEGWLQFTNGGSVFLRRADGGEDLRVNEDRLQGVLPDDKVVVRLPRKTPQRGRPKVDVVALIERTRRFYVGILQRQGATWRVAVDLPGYLLHFKLNNAPNSTDDEGKKVVIEVIDWPSGQPTPQAELREILGTPGDNDTEMQAIAAEFGFPLGFTQDALNEAHAFPPEPGENEAKGRRDFRSIPTITIDPVDARDFDDALSLRKLSDDRWELGVHIADVSHYVQSGGALDRDARERATSVYLVDRVMPMLPEHLSNLVCSLRPDEDKLAFSAVFEIDGHANVHDEWYGRTIIRSRKRLTYEEAEEVIVQQRSVDIASAFDWGEMVLELNGLALALKAKRFAMGSIRFESEELRFQFDEQGKPTEVFVKPHLQSHSLIEECMLLANRSVSAFMAKQAHERYKNAIVYRVHDQPDPERLDNFARFAALFGYKIRIGSREQITTSLNDLADQLEGKPEAGVVESMAIRSMAKARYTTQNIGHYGLAFTHYTHFTSPIRRYPDLMIHRQLQDILDAKPPMSISLVEADCVHSSDREKAAVQAERISVKIKQIEMLEGMTGKLLEGWVSGIQDFGFFVTLHLSRGEGLVRFNSMVDDRYFFDERTFSVRAQRSRLQLRLGDQVRVLLKKADIRIRQVDFEFIPDHKD
ncbi:MAG: ribonuclease R [Bacteroidia bacterium]